MMNRRRFDDAEGFREVPIGSVASSNRKERHGLLDGGPALIRW
jgi:hypothetical protein